MKKFIIVLVALFAFAIPASAQVRVQVGNDCGCSFGGICRCGQKCQCNGELPRATAPKAPQSIVCNGNTCQVGGAASQAQGNYANGSRGSTRVGILRRIFRR